MKQKYSKAVFVLALALGISLIMATSSQSHKSERTCAAPCIVKFSNRIQEDEFKIDFQDGQVRVWQIRP